MSWGQGTPSPGLGKRRWEGAEKAALERKIGQQTLEIDFLKHVWQKEEETPGDNAPDFSPLRERGYLSATTVSAVGWITA